MQRSRVQPAAIALALQIGPLAAGALDGEDASLTQGLCPAGDKQELITERERSQADRDAIEKTSADWAEAVLNADVEALGLLVTEDAEFWTHGTAPLVGRRALIAAFEPFLASYELQQAFDCQELILGGDWALMRGMEINRLTPRDGGESVVRRQRAFSVLRRESNGKWLFARGMTNLPPDASEAPRAVAPAQGYVLKKGQAETLLGGNGEVTIIASPATGSRHFAMGTQQLRPGSSVPVHRHEHADEAFFVHHGGGVGVIGDERSTLLEGDAMYIPRGVWHGFETESELELVWFIAPPGLDEFFRETRVPPGTPLPSLSPEEMEQIGLKHGIRNKPE